MRKLLLFIIALLPIVVISQTTIEGAVFVPDKNSNFNIPLNAGRLVFELDSNKIYKLTSKYASTDDMAEVFTDGNYVVIAGGEIWRDYGSYIRPTDIDDDLQIGDYIRHYGDLSTYLYFLTGQAALHADNEVDVGKFEDTHIRIMSNADSISVYISATEYLNTTFQSRRVDFYQQPYMHDVPNGSANDSILTITSNGQVKAISKDRWNIGSGTVTEVTSSTTNQLTVANGTTTPALSIVTAAVTNGGTGLATGDQIYDFVTGLGYLDEIVDDATPQLGAYLDLNDKGYTLELKAGETLSAGNLCCFKNSDGEMYLADADAVSTSGNMLALCLESLTDGNTGTFLIKGVYTTSGLTNGIQYVSTTAGEITGTAPSGTGDIVRIVGYNISATKFFFDPDQTYITLN